VDDHVERPVEEQLRRAHPLFRREQDPLAGRAEREDPVDAAVLEEVQVRTERVVVQLEPAVT
jgi:hypothetical protein